MILHIDIETMVFGFLQIQATPTDILKEALFKFQLERNSITSTPYELTFIASADNVTSKILASLDWEEISR